MKEEKTSLISSESSQKAGKKKKKKDTLYITEIFYSIQGESNDAGYPCVFVRLSGCDLRCVWCDTEYSFQRGTPMTLDEIADQVASYGVSRVEITGGEPLLQKRVFPLMDRLVEEGYRVLLETGGHRDISRVNEKVAKVMDIKCPDSEMSDRVRWENLEYIESGRDVVKFVLASRKDYEFARRQIKERKIPFEVVHLSVVTSSLDPNQVAQWILEDRLEVKMQLQLHKIIGVS